MTCWMEKEREIVWSEGTSKGENERMWDSNRNQRKLGQILFDEGPFKNHTQDLDQQIRRGKSF